MQATLGYLIYFKLARLRLITYGHLIIFQSTSATYGYLTVIWDTSDNPRLPWVTLGHLGTPNLRFS